MSPPIIHQRHTDHAAALARARNALRDHEGSIPRAADALGCSAAWLRAWVAADTSVAEGITIRPRGWTKGRKRSKQGTTEKS